MFIWVYLSGTFAYMSRYHLYSFSTLIHLRLSLPFKFLDRCLLFPVPPSSPPHPLPSGRSQFHLVLLRSAYSAPRFSASWLDPPWYTLEASSFCANPTPFPHLCTETHTHPPSPGLPLYSSSQANLPFWLQRVKLLPFLLFALSLSYGRCVYL